MIRRGEFYEFCPVRILPGDRFEQCHFYGVDWQFAGYGPVAFVDCTFHLYGDPPLHFKGGDVELRNCLIYNDPPPDAFNGWPVAEPEPDWSPDDAPASWA